MTRSWTARRAPRPAVCGFLLAVAALPSCSPGPEELPTAAEVTPAATSPADPPASRRARPSPGSSASPTSRNPGPDQTRVVPDLPVDAGALVERFRVVVRDGMVDPRSTEIEVPVGDTIELAVASDVDGTLRATGLGVSHDVTAGAEAVVPITVKRAGLFEVVLDELLVAIITVQ